MEEKFLFALEANRQKAESLGVRIRPVLDMKQAHQILSGHKASDGFMQLAAKGRLDLSLEVLSVKRQFTSLFSDDEANNALTRLLEAGYRF